jgi:hypothetical protein
LFNSNLSDYKSILYPYHKSNLHIMTIQEASDYIESLKSQTTTQSEIKVYEKFNSILAKLIERDFSKAEIQSIETELESLNLETHVKDRKKYISKSLSRFETYLKDTFSLIPKGYYVSRGIGLGLSFGIVFGIIFLSSFERSMGIALGMSIGMVLGLTIGASIESKAKSVGKIL